MRLNRLEKKIVLLLLFFAVLVAFGCVQEKNQPVRVGAILPLTGQNSVYGVEIQNAIEMAKDEINLGGGINARPLEVIYEDDAASPVLGTNAMQKLIEVDNVSVVFGPWASGVVLAVAPIAEKSKTLVMAEALSPQISTAGDYIFRIQPSAEKYTSMSAEFLVKNKISTAGILFINNEFGRSLREAFVSDFEKLGGKVIEVESYEQGDSDFRGQLAKIKKINPEVIFIAGYQDTIDVVRQMNELGINSKILAGPPFESKSTLDKLGPLAEGIIYPSHFVAGKNLLSKKFEEKYLVRYGVQPESYAPLMYDAVFIISIAMKKCGTDTNCIKNTLYDTNYLGVVGMVTFDANGDPNTQIFMKTVKNGEFVEYGSD